MRALMVAVLCVTSAACTFDLTPCANNDVCGAGNECVEGFCARKSDGGTAGGGGGGTMGGGGGGVTGGGGGTTGGGTGGGGGGGGGGGMNAYCDTDVVTSCAPYEECEANIDGGTCVSSQLTVTWTSPADGMAFRTSPVAATLSVTKADGGAVTLTSVPVTGAVGMNFLGSGGNYSGELEFLGLDGPRTFTAGWGSVSKDLTLEFDRTPPDVSVVVESRPATSANPEPNFTGFWKKDELATVRVTVDGGRPATSSDFIVPWGGAVTASSACTGACTGNCKCFEIDLGAAPVAGMRGTPAIQVNAIADSAGNLSASQDAGIDVTRFRWESTLTLSGPGVAVLPVAVSSNGLVVWGAENTSGITERLHANLPSGATSWVALGVGSLTAGPMLGTVDAWVATDVAGSSGLQAVALSSGFPAVPAQCSNSGRFGGDLALGSADVPIGVRSGIIQGPVGGGCAFHSLANPTPIATSRYSLVVRAGSGSFTEAFIAFQNESRLWKENLDPAGPNWSGQGSATLPGTQPQGLFFGASNRVGGGGGVVGNLFATPAGGPLDGGALALGASAANASAPAVGPGYVLYGTASGSLVKVPYDSSGFDAGSELSVMNAGAGDLQATVPVLGESGFAYAVGAGGILTVRRTSDLSQVWFAQLDSVSGAGGISHAALDVYRTSAGAKDCTKPYGVLYVTTRTGTTATLRAILVDSRGLDRDAPWPKYQRTNANTGNIDLPTAPWTCP